MLKQIFILLVQLVVLFGILILLAEGLLRLGVHNRVLFVLLGYVVGIMFIFYKHVTKEEY